MPRITGQKWFIWMTVIMSAVERTVLIRGEHGCL
jgi:hypothetical protein